MNKRLLFSMIVLALFFSTSSAQFFEVLGDRHFTAPGWDGGSPNNTFFDEKGDFYVYVNEKSTPRNHELVKYNFDTEEFELLTHHDFNIEGGVSTSQSVGFPDGSMYTVSRTFENELVAHHFMADGTFEFLGENPIALTPNVASCAMDSQGNFYAAGSLLSSVIRKFDGTNWTELQSLNNNIPESTFFTQFHFDEDDVLYASFIAHAQGDRNFFLQEYNPDDNLWSTRAFIANVNYNSQVSWVSPTEVYIMVVDKTLVTYSVYYYDGEVLELLGEPFENQNQEGGDLLMSKQGTLYAGVGEDMYTFDFEGNEWEMIDRNFPDGDDGPTSGYLSYLNEDKYGRIFNAFLIFDPATTGGFTSVMYTPEYVNVSVDDESFANEVTIFPNPATDFITIESESNIIKVNIYSTEGKLIKESNDTVIDVSKISSGLYSIEIVANDRTTTKKIIISN